jgi:hypothetical protein
LGIATSDFPSFPKCASRRRTRASRFSLELKKLVNQIFLVADVPCQQICYEQVGKYLFSMQDGHHGPLVDSHYGTIGHCGCGG